MPLKRPLVLLSVLVTVTALAGLSFYRSLSRDVGHALVSAASTRQPLQFVALATPASGFERWGGGEVEAVAVSADSLLTAGGFGVADEGGDISGGLPTLKASALTLWRGRPVAALAAGGWFLRRDNRWEEARTGFGVLHVRTLVEGPGGELLIGAREGLFRAAWGANSMDRLDAAPVRSIAVADGVLLAGGEEGLRRLEGGTARALLSPDPWVEWVGLDGRQVVVATALGLARGPLGGSLVPLPGGQDATSACLLEGRVFALSGGSLLRFEGGGAASEEMLPAVPRRVLASGGHLLVDTDAGLYRRTRSGWAMARTRPPSLPPGPSHVNALAFLGSRLVLGLFDGGLLLGEAQGAAWRWRSVPDQTAWGVNALLPAGGALYVASLRGAARFDGQHLTPIEPTGAGAAFSLGATRNGVAIGYGQGVLLPGSRLLSAFHGLPGNQALALASGPDLFVGTPSGLGAISDSRVAWRVAAGEGKLPHPWVTSLAVFGDALYVGTYGGGVTRRIPRPGGPASGAFDGFAETEGLKVNPGCLLEAGGRLYLGTDGRGLYRLSRDRRRFLAVRPPLPSPRITALLASPEGLLVGTDEGLARLPLASLDEEP